MESLREISNTNELPLLTNNHKLNEIICFFNWLDTKLKISDDRCACINKMDLQKKCNNFFLVIIIMKILIQ